VVTHEVASGDPRSFGNTLVPLTKIRGGGSSQVGVYSIS
jgi:hypothetical protein